MDEKSPTTDPAAPVAAPISSDEHIATLRDARDRAKALLETLVAQEREMGNGVPGQFHAPAMSEGRNAFRNAVTVAAQMLDDLEQALAEALDSGKKSGDHTQPAPGSK